MLKYWKYDFFKGILNSIVISKVLIYLLKNRNIFYVNFANNISIIKLIKFS